MQRHTLQSVDTLGRGLILIIDSVGDRFGHSIAVVNGLDSEEEKVEVVFSSLEGTDVQAWPSSPPLQDFSIEDRGQEKVLLAVGMAGKSHWSASVVSDSGRRSLEFDIACRVDPGEMNQAAESPTQPADGICRRFIGSSYLVGNSWKAVKRNRPLVLANGNSQIEIESGSAGEVQWDENLPGMVFQPEFKANNSLPTVRRQYSLRNV